jgi:hypothetical protein
MKLAATKPHTCIKHAACRFPSLPSMGKRHKVIRTCEESVSGSVRCANVLRLNYVESTVRNTPHATQITYIPGAQSAIDAKYLHVPAV